MEGDTTLYKYNTLAILVLTLTLSLSVLQNKIENNVAEGCLFCIHPPKEANGRTSVDIPTILGNGKVRVSCI